MLRIAVTTEAPAGEMQVRFVPPDKLGTLPTRVPAAEFGGKLNETVLLHAERLLAAGIGAEFSAGADCFRSAAGVAGRQLQRIGHSSVTLDLKAWPTQAGPVVEGFMLGWFRSEMRSTAKGGGLRRLNILIPAASKKNALEAVRTARILAEATNYARRIGNLPSNYCSPETLAAEARRLAKEEGLRCEVLEEAALRKQGCGGLLAVASGSRHGPRLIILEHRGGKPGVAPQVVLGKAVTFDSGGLSLKTRDGMHEMVWDKTGGTAVLGIMEAAAKLRIPKNIVGVLAAAENMPDGAAYRPGDVLTMADGTLVEINNTDAEGRLVLADAIAYLRRKYRPKSIVDLATLTGAVGVALGDAAAGLWSTDTMLIQQIRAAGEQAGERVWHMPLFPEYEEAMRGEFAELKNSGGRLAGACTGAAFLKHFAKDTPWAHLDIGEMAYTVSDRPHLAKGATGFGVRTIVRWLQQK